MTTASKSFSLSIKVLTMLEDEARAEGVSTSFVLDRICHEHYGISKEEE